MGITTNIGWRKVLKVSMYSYF